MIDADKWAESRPADARNKLCESDPPFRAIVSLDRAAVGRRSRINSRRSWPGKLPVPGQTGSKMAPVVLNRRQDGGCQQSDADGPCSTLPRTEHSVVRTSYRQHRMENRFAQCSDITLLLLPCVDCRGAEPAYSVGTVQATAHRRMAQWRHAVQPRRSSPSHSDSRRDCDYCGVGRAPETKPSGHLELLWGFSERLIEHECATEGRTDQRGAIEQMQS